MAVNTMIEVKAALVAAKCTSRDETTVHASMADVLKALFPPPLPGVEPLFYVREDHIFQRPVRTAKGVRMGFSVCQVLGGVDVDELCAMLNKAEPATE